MKKFLRFLVVLTAASFGLCGPQLSFGANFEGKVKMKIQSGKSDPAIINYAMKGNRVRIEIPTGKESAVGLLDWEKREMSMLMPGQNMYMVMELKDVPVIENEIKKSQDSTKLEKTSETATIVGREATKYIAKDGKNVTELWLASGIGSFFNMSGGSNPMKPKKLTDWEKELIAKQLFPLRTVSLDSKGRPSSTMEVVELTPQKLDDAMFLPPPGYTRFSMGGLLKGMGGK